MNSHILGQAPQKQTKPSDPQKENFENNVYALWIILKVDTKPFFLQVFWLESMSKYVFATF